MREQDFISRIRTAVHTRNKPLIKGIGDDCAVIDYTKQTFLLLTADSLAEGVHFKRKYFRPAEIGARAMAVNISDICAMGGVPRYALVSVGFDKKEKQPFIDAVYKGMLDYAENYGIDIIGGDTIGSKSFFLSITLIGEIEKKRVMLRGGARAGDSIYVTGLLGDSYAGLKVLNKKSRDNLKPFEYLPVKKHILPLPRYMEGRMLSQSGLVNACIDISDGLAIDAGNIAAESGKGAVIYWDRLPVSVSAQKVASGFGALRRRGLRTAVYSGQKQEEKV
jgi:thiamine-monophosphate kinase